MDENRIKRIGRLVLLEYNLWVFVLPDRDENIWLNN